MPVVPSNVLVMMRQYMEQEEGNSTHTHILTPRCNLKSPIHLKMLVFGV